VGNPKIASKGYITESDVQILSRIWGFVSRFNARKLGRVSDTLFGQRSTSLK